MNIAICTDCHLAAQGYDAHETGHAPDREPLSQVDAYDVIPNVDIYAGNPMEPHFSWEPCQGCGSTLGGDRYDYLALEREQQCIHGLSAWLCMGPQHYPSRQDEMSGRYYS